MQVSVGSKKMELKVPRISSNTISTNIMDSNTMSTIPT